MATSNRSSLPRSAQTSFESIDDGQVVPKSVDGTPNPKLSTHEILFEDEHGQESSASRVKAKRCILQGAQLLRQARRPFGRLCSHRGAWSQAAHAGALCLGVKCLHSWAVR